MAEVPENTKYLLFGYGPKLHALMALIANPSGSYCPVFKNITMGS